MQRHHSSTSQTRRFDSVGYLIGSAIGIVIGIIVVVILVAIY